MSIQALREKLAEPQLQFSARAEFAKVGFDIGEVYGSSDDGRPTASDYKSDRAKMRRAVSDIQAAISSGKISATLPNGSFAQGVADALAWGGAFVEICDKQIDLSSSMGRHTGGDGAVRDVAGEQVGINLPRAVLRNSAEIADRLGVRNEEGPSIGEFCRGVAGLRATTAVRNALSVGTDSAGGYTVPTVLLPNILSALVPASSMLQAGANIVVLNDQARAFNIAAVNALPTAAWRLESGAVAESDPTFRSIALNPRSLAFRFKVSRELLADSPDLDQALMVAIAGAFAKELDRAGLRGTGTAPEIRGLLNTVGVQAITNGAAGASLANYSNFISGMQAVMTADAPAPTAAIMAPRSYGKIAGFADTTGQPLRRPVALEPWQMIATSAIPVNLTVGASTDCSELYVGDFSQFSFFMREGVSVQLATELHAATGEVGFICHTRVDCAALYPAAFAVVTGVRA